MKFNITRALFFLALGLSGVVTQAQSVQPPSEKFDLYINQVYINSGEDFIKPDSRRYVYFKELFLNRIRFVKSDGKKLSLDSSLNKLSSVGLYNTYNKGLMRDMSFDPTSFNPFKYNLDFYSAEKLIYWVDNSDYLLVITPQERN